MNFSLFVLVAVTGCIVAGEARLIQCLSNSCNMYSVNTGGNVLSACEPRNLRKNVASFAEIVVAPPNATCGNPPSQFCSLNNRHYCMKCNNDHKSGQDHPPSHMVDGIKWTWWQSKPWPGLPGRSFEVNITLNLPKTFILIDDIIVDFHDGLPLKMVVDKSSDFGKTWTPMQYYADDCLGQFLMKTTNLNNPSMSEDDAVKPFCTNEFSSNYIWLEQSVLRVHVGPRIRAIRQNGINDTSICASVNDRNSDLGRFLLITNLRLRLLHPPVVQTDVANGGLYQHSEHYGIKKIHIPGRCFCNGHAEDCDFDSETVQCMCHHNTAGKDCERCRDFYWMKPWSPGIYVPNSRTGLVKQCFSFRDVVKKSTGESLRNSIANTKDTTHLECNCNGHSERCEYTEQMGTLCVDCRHNTIGQFCQNCRNKFYRDSSRDVKHPKSCKACNCNKIGSVGQWCQPSGQCKCKPNFRGRRCNACKAGWTMRRSICKRIVPECSVQSYLCEKTQHLMAKSRIKCLEHRKGRCLCINPTNCTEPAKFVHAKGIGGNGSSVMVASSTHAIIFVLIFFINS